MVKIIFRTFLYTQTFGGSIFYVYLCVVIKYLNMMNVKNGILLLVLLLMWDYSYAQLEVKDGSFKEVPGFVNINPDDNYQTDDNDLPFAVIKVRTENINDKQRRELKFSGNAGTFIMLEYKDGEVWVYLTAQYADYLKISHPDFSSIEFTLPYDLKPKCGYEMTLINKTVSTVNGYGSITITTIPDDAILTLDGRVLNKNPYSNDMMPAGKHIITVSKERYKTDTKYVEIKDKSNENLKIELSPICGEIYVNSDPIGAAVYVDGYNKGETPLVIKDIIIGTHELRLEKKGCASVIKSITIDERDGLTINEILLTGKEISISTDNIGDTIFIDGNFVGISPLTATISFDKHIIKAVHEDKEISKMITVSQSGETITVHLAFFGNKTITVNGISFEMIAVEGGTFTMGCTYEQGGDGEDDEKPTHNVTLNDYYIGMYEVTQELWYAIMGTTVKQQRDKSDKYSLTGEGNNYPMYYISWDECQEFIEKLNKETGLIFRLPTEAEWEYAARGGNKSGGYKYSGSNDIEDVAWYRDNSGNHTHQVGTKLPNELGIYDMNGNVQEWCQDRYGLYSSGSHTNPTGPGSTSGPCRVRRGGGFYDIAGNDILGSCRVSDRVIGLPDTRLCTLGFRLAASK